MKQETGFYNGDRYKFDFELYTTKKGWAQADTGQDTHYYGNWIDPFQLKLFCYCEGDTTLTICNNESEFVAEVERLKKWALDNTCKFGIDPGFNEELKNKLVSMGISLEYKKTNEYEFRALNQ